MTFRDLSTKKKILLGTLLPLVSLLVLAAVTVTNLRSILETDQWVDHSHEVLTEAESTIASAVDMETGMRGYLLSGKETFLEPYHSGSNEAFLHLGKLQEKVGDNPGQVNRLEEA